jgi:hypothetical protein
MFHLVDFSENPQWFIPDEENNTINPNHQFKQKKPKTSSKNVNKAYSQGSKKIDRKDPRYSLGSVETRTPLPDLSKLPKPNNNRTIYDAVKDVDSKHSKKALLKKLINPYTLVGASAVGVGTFAYLSHKHGKK